MSMISQIMIATIDSRLKQLKSSSEMFGGVSLILAGDPAQLLPVCGSPLYDENPKKSMLALLGKEIYFQFKFVVKLNQVVRQQNSDNNPLQQAFIELLPRIKDGKATIEDWLTLQTRIPTCKNEDEFKNAIHLFMDNDSVDRYNNEKLVQIKSPITKISAKNSNAKVFFFIIYF
jgi:hypothetical protein